MQLIVGKDYDEMSDFAAAGMLAALKDKKNPLVCLPSGSSPVGLCEKIREYFDASGTKPDWYFVGLDEWVGMDGADNGSCRHFFDEQLLVPMQMPVDRISFFDGKSNKLEEECRKAENFISTHGGIDIAVLGIGMNGHLGFNEPGVDPASRAHVVELDEVTQTVGQKYFTEKKELKQGITLGISTLMEARKIFLLVSGKHKSPILKKAMQDEISNRFPATLLRNHPDYTIYADADAAEGIGLKS
jgi:glucosamine-6-phosphate isomerase